MHDDFVERKRWISSEDFFHALSHCMIFPARRFNSLLSILAGNSKESKGHHRWGTLTLALIRLARCSLVAPIQWTVALGALVAMIWLHASIPWVMLAAVAIGLVLARYRPSLAASTPSIPAWQRSKANGVARRQALLSFVKIITTGVLIWLAPLVALYVLGRDFDF
jgi:chromate transporter